LSSKVGMLRESRRITQMRQIVSVGASFDFQLAGPAFKRL